MIEPGTNVDVTIDGTTVRVWKLYDPRQRRQAVLSPRLSGRPKVRVQWRGDGLPDQPDGYDFALEWAIDVNGGVICELLERYRAMGGTRLFTDWKPRMAEWTARSGQQMFKLPRVDAFTKHYVGRDGVDYQAVWVVNGVAWPVQYHPTVNQGTVVPPGEIWIGEQSSLDDLTGWTINLAKSGTALVAGTKVEAAFCHLFKVFVTDVVTKPFEGSGIREDKAMFMIEVS